MPEKDLQNKTGASLWLKPALVFFGKTSGWIVLPLLIILLINKMFHFQNEYVFFALMIFGFGIACSGIYKEIKIYQKTLEEKSKK